MKTSVLVLTLGIAVSLVSCGQQAPSAMDGATSSSVVSSAASSSEQGMNLESSSASSVVTIDLRADEAASSTIEAEDLPVVTKDGAAAERDEKEEYEQTASSAAGL